MVRGTGINHISGTVLRWPLMLFPHSATMGSIYSLLAEIMNPAKKAEGQQVIDARQEARRHEGKPKDPEPTP